MDPQIEAQLRHVSVFVKVEASDQVEPLRRTLLALDKQDHVPDRVILGLNAGCSADMHDFVRRMTNLEGGGADHRFADDPAVTVDATFEADSPLTLAEMTQRFLDEDAACARRQADDSLRDGESPEQPEPPAPDSANDETAHARDFSLLSEDRSDSSLPKTHSAAMKRGRRARAVDLEQQTREVERTAVAESLVPERLRTHDSHRSGGRRRKAVQADQQWLWFLTAGAVPNSGALSSLIGELDRTPTLALVGPKHLAAEDVDDTTSRIVDLGITLTPSHRMVTSVEPGEIDQGQADWRREVLAVAMPGMLIREETFRRLGGFDQALTSPWAEIDLSQRVWRSGERVQVVPAAHARTPLAAVDEATGADFRVSQVLSLIKFRSLGWALATLLLLPVVTLIRMIRGVVVHDASIVGRELTAFLRIVAGAPSMLVAGRRTRSTSRVSRRRLSPLYMPWSVSARERIDSWWTLLFSDDDRSRHIRRSTWGISGTNHGLDDADYGRHTVWTVIVGLVSAVAGIIAARSLLREGSLVGGALVAPSSSVEDARDSIFSSWIPTALGIAGPTDPFARLIGHVPLTGNTILTVLYVLIVPVTAIAAWVAAGTISRSVVVRLVATLMWVTAPPFTHAFAEGRWTMLLVHALIPIAAQCLARAIGLPHKVSQASIAAAAGGGLLVALIASIQPALGLALLLGLALVAPFVPGRRRRLWWFVVPVAAVLAPNLMAYVRYPESLLTPAGMPFDFERAPLWSMALLSPSSFDPVASALGVESSPWTVVLGAAPLIVAAVCALGAPFLNFTAGLAARISIVSAAAAYGLAIVCSNAVVGIDGADPFVAYPGGALSLAAAALITGFVCVGDAVARRAHQPGRGRKAAARVGSVVALVVGAVVALGWLTVVPAAMEVEPTTSPEIPAVAADAGLSNARSRTLVLAQDANGVVTARPITGAGITLDKVSSQVMAHEADEAEQGRAYDGATEQLVSAVAQNLGATSTQASSTSLGSFGIAYVVVPGDVNAQAQLVDTLNTSPRFEQVTVSETGGLWRVVDPGARAIIVDQFGSQSVLSSERTEVHAQIAASSEERTIRLNERADPRWVATLGDEELEPVESDSWSQEFSVPAGAEGDLAIRYVTPFVSALIIGSYIVLAVCVLVAIPWRRTKEQN